MFDDGVASDSEHSNIREQIHLVQSSWYFCNGCQSGRVTTQNHYFMRHRCKHWLTEGHAIVAFYHYHDIVISIHF